jgi:hypothetical protein
MVSLRNTECPIPFIYNLIQTCTFLAHVWALTMTCCPSSSSVSRACFVTAGAIYLKLCTYVPLGEMTLETKFWSDLILGLATRGPKNRKHKKCCNSSTNGWIISKFLSWVHLIRIHDIIPVFLIWPTFEGHRGQVQHGTVGTFRYYLT